MRTVMRMNFLKVRIQMKKSLMIVSFSKSSSDPRLMRQIEVLREVYTVDVAGYGPAPAGVRRFHEIPRRLSLWEQVVLYLARMFGLWKITAQNRKDRALASAVSGEPYDLVIANDLETLPAVFAGKRRALVLLDAHEYSPRQFEDRLFWRLVCQKEQRMIATKYLPRLAGAFTVCEGIAGEYRREYGLESRVLTNAASYHDLQPSAVEEGRIRMVHPGTANPSRKLELMIEAFSYLDERFTLDFYLMPNHPDYLRHLKKLAGRYGERIRFREPVDMCGLIPALNEYDVGFFLLPPVNFNYRHALPNKLFQFVQARLAVAIGPSPEMARLAVHHGFGVVSESFLPEDMAAKLNALTVKDLERLKSRAHDSAADLSDVPNRRLILDTVRGILADGECQ